MPTAVRCNKGCRVKVHGNKGKKATPKQAAALRKGREKAAMKQLGHRKVATFADIARRNSKK